MKRRYLAVTAALLGATALGAGALAADLETARPEAVGLSATRLGRVDAAVEADVAAKRIAGAVVLVARNGKVVQVKAYGMADAEARTPMRADSLFRLYSTTKPMVSVGLLMLYEEGKFQLSDPVEKYIPEFAKLQVMERTADGRTVMRAPRRKPTMHDVMRHTAGFPGMALASFGGPVEQAWMAAKLDAEPAARMRQIADLPLLYDPGEDWRYGPEHDIQGYLVETLSGMPLDRFLEERLFRPLKMADTFYRPPAAKMGRYTTAYSPDGAGGLKATDTPKESAYLADAQHPRGSSGLSSTAGDVARFAQMLLNEGELDGVRILSRKTVEMMTSDQLPAGVKGVTFGPGREWGGARYGLGIGVLSDVGASERLGSAGTYGWPGFGTTNFEVDPKEKLVMVVLTQKTPTDMAWLYRVQTLIYQAVAD